MATIPNYRDKVPFRLTTGARDIRVYGDLAPHDLRKVVTAIDAKARIPAEIPILLDFSRCTLAFAPSMLPICAICAKLQLADVKFDIVLPDDDRLSRLFINANWAHLICPTRFAPNIRADAGQLPAMQYVDSTGQNATVNRVLDVLLGSMRGMDRSHLQAVEWSLNEITDNVLNHSQCVTGGMVQLNLYKQKKAIEFVVADAGVGIPKTLRAAMPSLTSDVQALGAAIEEGVTRNKLTNAGNGLFGSYRIANLSNGFFSINSGDASLVWSAKSGSHVKTEPQPFPGTTVVCSISYAEPLLLQKALTFRTGPHTPALDYVDARYETDERGAILFRLKDENQGFRSRDAGKVVKNKLENLLVLNTEHKIVVDFSDVVVISSSFADEVFGKIFAEVGPLTFMSAIEFRNVDATVKTIIERAIRQRAGGR